MKRKISYKKISIAVLWIAVLTALVSSLGFVSKAEKNIVAKNLNIIIHNNDENFFVAPSDVRKFFEERKEAIISRNYKDLDLHGMEMALNGHPALENAEVSGDIHGEIKIEVTQRTPIVRIFNKDGESYYIDTKNKTMPLSENYSARTLIANGEIFEPYSGRKDITVGQIRKSKLFKEISLLDDILDVTEYINGDSCLSALIHQIYVNKDREMELFPAIGNQKIIFGNAENIKEKFQKLKLFYTQGLNKADAWTKYSSINLKYRNLVVCTKK